MKKKKLAWLSVLYVCTGILGFVFVMLWLINHESFFTMINGMLMMVFSMFILAVISNYRKNYLD